MKENAKIHKNRYMVKIILLRSHFCLRKMLSKHPLLVKNKECNTVIEQSCILLAERRGLCSSCAINFCNDVYQL